VSGYAVRKVRYGDRGEHKPRTQRFCRTSDRFGVANRPGVGENHIRAQFREVPGERAEVSGQ
jgi:hypothetical protein